MRSQLSAFARTSGLLTRNFPFLLFVAVAATALGAGSNNDARYIQNKQFCTGFRCDGDNDFAHISRLESVGPLRGSLLHCDGRDFAREVFAAPASFARHDLGELGKQRVAQLTAKGKTRASVNNIR